MNDDIKALKALVQHALNLTKQGSYQRRAPSRKAVPVLIRARDGLESWTKQNGENPEMLRLLAITHEALLNYDTAARILGRAIAITPRPNQKDLKRLAAYREAGEMWRTLSLNPEELDALGKFLKDKLLDSAPERSLRWTEVWLDEKKPREKESVIDSLRKLGYPSDYDILHNLVPG